MANKRSNNEIMKIIILSVGLFILYIGYKFLTQSSKKKWTPEQIRLARKHGLINDKNNWTPEKRNEAQRLGLDSDEPWTPSEYEKAEKAGLLSKSITLIASARQKVLWQNHLNPLP